MVKSSIHYFRPALRRICSVHLWLLAGLAAQTIAYDAWQLITPDAIIKRWFAIACLFVVVAAVYFIAQSKSNSLKNLHKSTWTLIITDVIFAAYFVFLTRGLASRAVILMTIPIICSAIFLSKKAIFLASMLSIAAYAMSCILYFKINFNEGYRIELYGEVGFYSFLMIILSGLLWSIVHAKKKI